MTATSYVTCDSSASVGRKSQCAATSRRKGTRSSAPANIVPPPTTQESGPPVPQPPSTLQQVVPGVSAPPICTTTVSFPVFG